jgi:putative PIN family toxin of toxin-antitoxin system
VSSGAYRIPASGFAGFRIAASTPGQILHHWRDRRFELIVSEHILAELANTLANPYFHKRLSLKQRGAALALLQSEAGITPITVIVHSVATHAEDDVVLATAVSAQANYLVTGDKKLQDEVRKRYW